MGVINKLLRIFNAHVSFIVNDDTKKIASEIKGRENLKILFLKTFTKDLEKLKIILYFYFLTFIIKFRILQL